MFLSLCHALNRLGLSKAVARLRKSLYEIFPSIQKLYKSEIIGYKGWYELPLLGVIVFIRSDDSLQFEW